MKFVSIADPENFTVRAKIYKLSRMYGDFSLTVIITKNIEEILACIPLAISLKEK